MLRFLLVVLICAFIFVIFGIPVMLIGLITGLFSKELRSKIVFYYLRYCMRAIIWASGVELTVLGLENIPDGTVFYVSNHRGIFDILTGYQFIKPLCGTVSKKEWGQIPCLHGLMYFLNCVFLDRHSSRAGLRVIDEVARKLNEGISFWICPEGTRSHSQTLLPFHAGSFRPAFMTGTPIVPITFVGTDDVFENHKPRICKTHVTVHFGEAITVEGLDHSEQHQLVQKIRQQIQDTYDSITLKDVQNELKA